MLLKVIRVRPLHTIKPTNALTLKLNFLHIICHNSDILRSIKDDQDRSKRVGVMTNCM